MAVWIDDRLRRGAESGENIRAAIRSCARQNEHEAGRRLLHTIWLAGKDETFPPLPTDDDAYTLMGIPFDWDASDAVWFAFCCVKRLSTFILDEPFGSLFEDTLSVLEDLVLRWADDDLEDTSIMRAASYRVTALDTRSHNIGRELYAAIHRYTRVCRSLLRAMQDGTGTAHIPGMVRDTRAETALCAALLGVSKSFSWKEEVEFRERVSLDEVLAQTKLFGDHLFGDEGLEASDGNS